MTRLILIRHGETDWNAEGRWQGQADVPLNEHGRAQAAEIAEALRDAGLSAIYASDLSRTRDTAEALARATGLTVRVDPRLREINHGVWEGMLFTDIEARYGEVLQRRRKPPYNVAPPGGESVGQVRERVLAAVGEIVRRHPGEIVAVVSHGMSLAIVRAHFAGLPIEKVWELVPHNGTPIIVDADR